MIVAYNIKWDVETPEELDYLPKEMEIPDYLTNLDDISDFLSDETGYCHGGFELGRKKKRN